MKTDFLLKQAGLSSPEMLTIAITDACNLDCAHCWVEAGSERGESRISISSLKKVLKDFVQLGGTGVRITGGEPLLYPEWLTVLAYAGELGLKNIILQTNAILFTPTDMLALSRLQLNELQIQISLDGARPESHDLVRGKGAFQKTVERLTLLVSYGLGPQINIFLTEMQHNLHELPELFAFAEKLGIQSVSSGCLVQCGRAGLHSPVAPPEPDQYLQLINSYHADSDFRQRYAKMGCVSAIEWCSSQHQVAGCCDFIQTPYLTTSGQLYPCLMCHADAYSIQDVYEQGLAAALIAGIPLWSELQRISRLRRTEIIECQTCALKLSCAGGCIGRTWGSFGEFMQPEDRCQQMRTLAYWKSNHE